MTQPCVFSFGFMCIMQAVMELIILAMSLPGRRTQTTSQNGPTAGHGGSPHAAPNPFMGGGGYSSSYTVTIKTSPFFCEEEGWLYNLQSAMMIANCVVFILGAILSKISYAEYPNSLFDDMGETQQFGGQAYGGGNAYGGNSGGHVYSGGHSRPAGNQNWGGGQRLGGGGGAGH